MSNFPMLQDPNFLPVLQTPGWKGRQHVPCACVITKEEPGDQVKLFAAFGVVDEGKNAYLTRESMASDGLSLDQVSAIAKQNLTQYVSQLEWQPVDAEGMNVLSLEGNECTSSALILEEYLAPLHQHFNSEMVFLAVPNRYSLFASDDALIFNHVIKDMYKESKEESEAALCPHVFVLQNGKIVGQATLEENNEEEKPEEELDHETLALVILSGPVSVFLMVAAADGNIDKKEIKSFLREVVKLSSKAGTPAPLKSLFQSLPSIIQPLLEQLISNGLDISILAKSVIASSQYVEKAFGKRVSKKYSQILIELATTIASASGGFLGLGPKIDKHERTVINALKKALRSR